MLPVSATVRAAFVGMLAMSAASARPAARGNHGSCASDSGAHSLSASSSASVSVSVSSSNAAASSSVAASASPDTGELVAVALKSATSARSATATHWRWSASSAAGSSATVKSATIKSTTTKSTTTKSTTTEATTTKSATAKSTTAKSATSKSATVKSASSVASATTATSASSATVASSATTSSASASSAISSSAGSSATASSSSSLSASTSASAPAASGTYYQPALDTLILVDLETTTLAVPAVGEDGLTISAGIYDIDYSVTADEMCVFSPLRPPGLSATGVPTVLTASASYHDQGLKVICYFPGGVWEAGLSDALSFDPACYCGANVTTDASGTCTGTGAEANKLADWDNWWFDIRANGSCLASVEALMQARIEAAAAKGCDGIDVDDMDAYENGSIFDITEDDEVSYLLWFAETAHANGLAIALKNAGGLLVDDNGDATTYQSELVAAFDLNVIESCHEYDECDIYDSMLAAGKPQIQMEYSNSITSCPALAAGQALAVYAGTDVFSSQISLWCS